MTDVFAITYSVDICYSGLMRFPTQVYTFMRRSMRQENVLNEKDGALSVRKKDALVIGLNQ